MFSPYGFIPQPQVQYDPLAMAKAKLENMVNPVSSIGGMSPYFQSIQQASGERTLPTLAESKQALLTRRMQLVEEFAMVDAYLQQIAQLEARGKTTNQPKA